MWNPFNRNTISNSSASKRSLQLITQKGMPFAYVEAYKALRTNLNFLSGSGDVHAFVVTSTVPEEAKTNVSVNLALALTESGKKVVLVDCDLRKPVLHRYLKAGHNLKGVSNVLSRQVALSDALVELKDIPNLTFLPAGTTPPNPSELLSQPQMQEMVDTLRGSYDFVILDGHGCRRHRPHRGRFSLRRPLQVCVHRRRQDSPREAPGCRRKSPWRRSYPL